MLGDLTQLHSAGRSEEVDVGESGEVGYGRGSAARDQVPTGTNPGAVDVEVVRADESSLTFDELEAIQLGQIEVFALAHLVNELTLLVIQSAEVDLAVRVGSAGKRMGLCVVMSAGGRKQGL